jgi:hypothetical protein
MRGTARIGQDVASVMLRQTSPQKFRAAERRGPAMTSERGREASMRGHIIVYQS